MLIEKKLPNPREIRYIQQEINRIKRNDKIGFWIARVILTIVSIGTTWLLVFLIQEKEPIEALLAVGASVLISYLFTVMIFWIKPKSANYQYEHEPMQIIEGLFTVNYVKNGKSTSTYYYIGEHKISYPRKVRQKLNLKSGQKVIAHLYRPKSWQKASDQHPNSIVVAIDDFNIAEDMLNDF